MARTVKQPDIRRQELLQIGVELYFKEGEKGVSIQQVVTQANVATGLFYYYFKTKDEFLDEALNGFIEHELQSFVGLLTLDLPASEKLDLVLDAYFEYAENMAPFRSNKAFQSEKHYALTARLTDRIQEEVYKVVTQGISEHSFDIQHPELIAGFIVNGLSSIFHPSIPLNKQTCLELKQVIHTILKVRTL